MQPSKQSLYTESIQFVVDISRRSIVKGEGQRGVSVKDVNGPPSLHALWGSGNLLSMSSCQEQERFCPWLESSCMM